jgi:predicted signal transduction protein with EAL and GGDEF domain
LIERETFLTELSGPFGYGRALHGRSQIGQLADWAPLVLPATTPLPEAAQALLAHQGRVRSLLLCRDELGRVRAVRAQTLFAATSELFARRALQDPLTGLANRAGFLQALTAACADLREGRVVTLYVDVDQFKAVNDTYGHAAGDLLLRAVGGRLRAAARVGDVVARLGGDEFAVLMRLPSTVPAPGEGTDQLQPDRKLADRLAHAQAEQVAQRFLDALSEPVELAGHALLGRVSIGVAVSPVGSADPDRLLREADTAMYEAKRAGGQRVAVRAGVGQDPADVLLVSDQIVRALQEGQFVLHYQPIVEAGSGGLQGVEALVRWQHPQHGLLPPGAFIPAAEANGTIVALGRWVLRAACAQLAEWDAQLGPAAPYVLNVNLSVRQLTDPELVASVAEVLARHHLDPARLHLELPEEATLSQLQHADGRLQQLRALGVRLTLDDMGAGSSTLRHATYLDVDGLKIDRELVAGMVDNERDLALVRLLVDLARSVGIPVTAEGVETPEQAALLTGLGAQLLQGYYFGRPQPAGELIRRLSELTAPTLRVPRAAQA